MAMSDPSGLQQLWELEKGLMETETLNLSEYSVDVAVKVSFSWLLLKSRWEGDFLEQCVSPMGFFFQDQGYNLSCNQGGISGTKRCFRRPKEPGNKKLNKLGEASTIPISVKYLFVSKTK